VLRTIDRVNPAVRWIGDKGHVIGRAHVDTAEIA
jgi:hypothetical protein